MNRTKRNLIVMIFNAIGFGVALIGVVNIYLSNQTYPGQRTILLPILIVFGIANAFVVFYNYWRVNERINNL